MKAADRFGHTGGITANFQQLGFHPSNVLIRNGLCPEAWISQALCHKADAETSAIDGRIDGPGGRSQEWLCHFY